MARLVPSILHPLNYLAGLRDVFEFWLFVQFSLFWDMVSCSPTWCLTHYVAKNDLEHLIFLPLYPESWDCTCVPPCLELRGGGTKTLGFMHYRQALCQLSYIFSSQALSFPESVYLFFLSVSFLWLLCICLCMCVLASVLMCACVCKGQRLITGVVLTGLSP